MSPLPPGSVSDGLVLPDRLLETHVASVLFSARRQRRTGILTIDETRVATRLHLVEGQIVFAEAGAVAKTLGRLLMRDGKLDRDEYLLVLQHMSESSPGQAAQRFGEIAIQLGMLTADDIRLALGEQVVEKLAHCLRVDEGTWHWEDSERPRETTPFPVNLEKTLRMALREDAQPYRWPGLFVPHRQRVARVRADPEEIAMRFEISPEELRLLRRLHGRPIANVLQAEGLTPIETGALLCALHFAGAMELGAHISVQSTRPNASAKVASVRAPAAASLPSTAARRGKNSSVARLRERRAGGARDKRESRLRAKEAARRLRSTVGRLKPDSKDRSSGTLRVDAGVSFEAGKRLLAQGHPERAVEAFRAATDDMPEAAEYQLYLLWAEYLAETDTARKGVLANGVKKAAIEALKQEREFAFAHYVQGRLAFARGDFRSATRSFMVAEKIEPKNIEFVRYVRLTRARFER